MPWDDSLVLALYLATLALLAIFGLHRYLMVFLYYRHKQNAPQAGLFEERSAPVITVQLPLYNECYVAERLIDAVAALDYPRESLEIQVLDDSTDDTQELARGAVERHQRAGIDIHYLHRDNRTGYKAGALEAGLKAARGEFVAIFDADFVPPQNVLRDAIPHLADPRIGMVQMRWDHINRGFSLLTRLQAILLDGHFVIEHTARNRSGRFFNFNGTAGIWRRRAIEDAGGWQHDTLTEDLDLSYRAQLKGWRFIYLQDLAAPGEIPVDINGFKSQQHRWTKGAIQTGAKLLPGIWSSKTPLKVKTEATFHLLNNLAYPLMLILSLLIGPALEVQQTIKSGLLHTFLMDIPLLTAATLSVGTYYLCSQLEIQRSGWKTLLMLPGVMALGIGLCVNNTRAVLEGIFGGPGEFVRTAKYRIEGQRFDLRRMRYSATRNLTRWIELALGIYFTGVVYYACGARMYATLPFLLLFAGGFLYVGILSFVQSWRPAPREQLA